MTIPDIMTKMQASQYEIKLSSARGILIQLIDGGGHVGSGWNYCVCVNDGPEKTLDVKDVIGNEDRVDADEKELNEEAVLSCEPHELCTFEYDESHHTRPTRLWDHQTLHLSLLRACRQTYAEANRVLWISNTFSFGDAIGFKQFMMTRNSHRKRLIRSLRFEMDYAFNRPDKWNNALQMSVVRSLSGLRSLRLQLVYNMDVSIWPMFGTSYFLEGAGCSEGLQRLSTLPLTAVEAVIRAPQRRLQTMMWKKDHREETAEALRQMLLNPKGVEVYQAAQQARKDMINGR